VGQCAVEKKRILLSDVPSDFISISSSLGVARRMSIVVLPVLFEGDTKAVIELASLKSFSPGSLAFLDLLTQNIGAVFNTIEATMRTEGLLTQSQQLTAELQSRQRELQQTNEELGSKAKLLADRNAEVERKNSEVEQARRALEEKAAELALTSKYKSEFLANMSHELRTPLNSICGTARTVSAAYCNRWATRCVSHTMVNRQYVRPSSSVPTWRSSISGRRMWMVTRCVVAFAPRAGE
jgi:signal transduction histidine kinase